jgi:antirestriction protein ArdC
MMTATKMKMKSNAMEVFTDKVIKALNEFDGEKLAWVRPWRVLDCQYRNAFSKHKYRGLHNILSCAIAGFNDPRFMTFNQVRKAGGKVISGEKATTLIAWKMTKIVKTNKDTGKDEVKFIPFSRTISVFNAEQTEGLDLPEINTDITNDDMEADDRILEIYEKLEVDSNITEDKTVNLACYVPSKDRIELPSVKQYDDVDQWSGTALHELVHWTDHKDRCDRDLSKYGFDIDTRAFEELIAELGSMFLQMQLGINGWMDQNNIKYIDGWKKATKGKKGDKFIYKACKLADEACKYIFENAEIVIEETEEDDDEQS